MRALTRRRAAIARTYSTGVRFADPVEIVTGHNALDAKAPRLLADSSGLAFTAAGSVLVNHNLGYLAWHLGPDGQPPAAHGIDIALVTDGMITELFILLLAD